MGRNKRYRASGGRLVGHQNVDYYKAMCYIKRIVHNGYRTDPKHSEIGHINSQTGLISHITNYAAWHRSKQVISGLWRPAGHHSKLLFQVMCYKGVCTWVLDGFTPLLNIWNWTKYPDAPITHNWLQYKWSDVVNKHVYHAENITRVVLSSCFSDQV